MSDLDPLEKLEKLFSRASSEVEGGTPPTDEILSEMAEALELLGQMIKSGELSQDQESLTNRTQSLLLKAQDLENKFLSQSKTLTRFIEESLTDDRQQKDVYSKPPSNQSRS